MYQIKEYTDSKTGNKVILAISTYAGKIVKGKAVCDPRDTYDYAYGANLAMRRCNAKVATKRRKNATKKYKEAYVELIKAKHRVDKMNAYLRDAIDEETKALEQD